MAAIEVGQFPAQPPGTWSSGSANYSARDRAS
jgi:hypothetical protein